MHPLQTFLSRSERSEYSWYSPPSVMDPSEYPTDKPSPRRELQGPRPTPLKVRKDSYKIKKPPMAPQPSQPPQQPPLHRPPVIIYTVSPKVIHTSASDFMALVQRLTGSSSSSSSAAAVSSFPSSPSLSSFPYGGTENVLSPAARLATIEKAKIHESEKGSTTINSDIMDQLDIHADVGQGSQFPGILSPVPSSLPPISPYFFSPSVDPNSLGFLHDLSPIFSSKNFSESTFLASPSALLSTPMPSPNFDLFNHFFDL